MQETIIIHNPRCSKSRETLNLLESHGIQPRVIDYLHGELDEKLLKKVISVLNVRPQELLRIKEEEFRDLKINLNDEGQVIKAILDCPKLLERPIVLKGNKAVIGRPPENVLAIIDKRGRV